MGSITLASGQIIGIYGMTFALYQDRKSYEAWHLSGDESGMIESREVKHLATLYKLCADAGASMDSDTLAMIRGCALSGF